jgi:hypothetical protein
VPVEAKPLFRPDVLKLHLSAFTMPAIDASKLGHWAGLIASGRIDGFREQEILRDFLTDVFVGVLGYTGPAAGHDRYTIRYERHVEVDGKFADAVLGDFNGHQRFVVAIEGKGPRDPLDRPFAGRRMSAVDQGYRYAINLPCDWILVTSMRQTRLYHKGSDQHTFERFETEQLADDDAALKRFVFLLGADRVVPTSGPCHFDALLAESEKVGRELTKSFYVNYANMRQDVYELLCRDNPKASRHDVLSSTQKLLDRVLFVAFSEDRGLVPVDSLRKAYEHADPYNPRPIWHNFRGLFDAINHGNAALGIHAYNGGLFAADPLLDSLAVSDEVCAHFRNLGDYDYRPSSEATGDTKVIDVDILGHIFEQSISDLEKLRNEADGLVEPQGADRHKTRRKKEGAFYTPSFITRYIVEQAVGGAVQDRFEHLRAAHQAMAKGAAKTALADPAVYEVDKLTKPARAALVSFWEAWQDELATIRVLDPACGSGAFLIEAFDQLHATYQQSNERLHELRGHRSLFEVDKRILENNLYGVDLNDEAIEIARLSLWIKTAQRGKPLTSLDHPIRVGNSVVDDLAVHPKAFAWQTAFPEVFEQGGFDVVIGNPPYVRQEWLSDFKPYLQSAYKAFHGMADLYVYFYELGINVLKPGGLLSFIVTNKWMKAGYGEPLRRFFSEHAWVESVVDFGHAKQIFEDADVFPSILVARKPTKAPKPKKARLCAIPREQLRVDDLSRQIETEGVERPLAQLGADSGQLEPPGVSKLMAKIREVGLPLSEFAGVKPLSGIKTGLNEAFLIDEATKEALLQADQGCASVLRPFLRGQDFSRWCADWAGLWMIVLKSSENHDWPWARAGENAEQVFAKTYPSLYSHALSYRASLEGRQDQGRYWWELRSCAYWEAFARPKIMYPEITWRSDWGIDRGGMLCNNTAYFLASDDPWILAVANSPVIWWYSWRAATHGKDEALRFIKDYVQSVPIPQPTDQQRKVVAPLVETLIRIAEVSFTMRRSLLDWLRVEHEIEKPSQKLQSPTGLDSDAFVAEVKKLRGRSRPLSAAGVKSLRDEYVRTIEPAKAKEAEALKLEHQLSDLVNEAYGLTPDEIALMWQTAPPRMPFTQSVSP